MATYVYKYSHPNHEWLYVGKADSTVKERVRAHRKEHKFKPFLNEVEIYYLELDNKAQSKFVESYLIDKYKPYLNKIDKYDGESPFVLNLPEWKLYESNMTYDKSCKILMENDWDKNNKEVDRLKREIEYTKIKCKKDFEDFRTTYNKEMDKFIEESRKDSEFWERRATDNFMLLLKEIDSHSKTTKKNKDLQSELLSVKQQNKKLLEQNKKLLEPKPKKSLWQSIKEAVLC